MATRTLNKLDPRTAATIKTAGRHSDGGGLYLSIDPTGRRRWVFMYTRDGKRTELGLGGGRDLTLANARKEAGTLRTVLASGGDPRSAREKQERQTFGEVADAYIEAMWPSWRNAKHAAQWTMTLTKYAAPIRPRMVETISTRDQHSSAAAQNQASVQALLPGAIQTMFLGSAPVMVS